MSESEAIPGTAWVRVLCKRCGTVLAWLHRGHIPAVSPIAPGQVLMSSSRHTFSDTGDGGFVLTAPSGAVLWQGDLAAMPVETPAHCTACDEARLIPRIDLLGKVNNVKRNQRPETVRVAHRTAR